MLDLLDILAAPFAACLLLAGILCYFGIHVIMREVIFVDLALAQIAAMGVAVGALLGLEPHAPGSYVCSLGFTVLGALVFTIGRFRDSRVPQEAIIGIVYAVSTAVALLILSKLAVEKDEIESMLVGRLLFVGWPEAGLAAGVFAAVGALHAALRRRFLAISTSAEKARAEGINVPAWDFVFYVTLGLVVTISVQMAGVLPVFCFLVVPASAAMIFFRSTRARLLAGWALGTAGATAGIAASALGDFPPGESVVTALGAIFALCALANAVRKPLV